MQICILKKHLTTLFFALMVIICLCVLLGCTEEAPNTAEPSNESMVSSKNESRSSTILELDQDTLMEIKMRVSEKFDGSTNSESYFLNITEEDYLKFLDFYQNNPENFDGEMLYRVIKSDIESETYHSIEIAKSLKEGMLINEVHDLLGQPHFNAVFLSGNISYTPGEMYDYCTIYLLNSGDFLFIRYTPMFIGENDRDELISRFPDFQKYEASYWRSVSNGSWGKLLEFKILTEKELLGIPFGRNYLRTKESCKPANVDKNILYRVKEGMHYEEVKTLLGSVGYDNAHYRYTWMYEDENAQIKEFVLIFELSSEGELVVSEIASQIT